MFKCAAGPTAKLRLRECLAPFHAVESHRPDIFQPLELGSPLCKSSLWIYQSVSIECSAPALQQIRMNATDQYGRITGYRQVCSFPFAVSLAQTLM